MDTLLSSLNQEVNIFVHSFSALFNVCYTNWVHAFQALLLNKIMAETRSPVRKGMMDQSDEVKSNYFPLIPLYIFNYLHLNTFNLFSCCRRDG